MLASNMTKVYNFIDSEMTLLRSELGSQVGGQQMSLNNIGSKYDYLDEKINSRLNTIGRVIKTFLVDRACSKFYTVNKINPKSRG